MSDPITPTASNGTATNGTAPAAREGIPAGLWLRCPECGDMLFRKALEDNHSVCPSCDHHFRLAARTRVQQVCDEGSFEELFADLEPVDPLKFVDSKAYSDRIR